MARQAFFLGFIATGGQILLLRELIASLGGSEVLVGLGLCGWLVWAGVGALWGGRSRWRVGAGTIFSAMAVLLPLLLVAVRLAPLAVTERVGDHIPFWLGGALAMSATAPIAFLSGRLFPMIASGHRAAVVGTVQVYVWEGVGAFAAGVATLILVGNWLTSLAMALILGVAVVIGGAPARWRWLGYTGALRIVAGVILMAAAPIFGQWLGVWADGVRYAPFEVAASFDTRCGHQTILKRESAVVLVTDGRVEADWPDVETAEELFVPPMLVNANCRKVMLIGRAEMLGDTTEKAWDDLTLEAVDNRPKLAPLLDSLTGQTTRAVRHTQDALTFVNDAPKDGGYDAIILPLSNLTSYEATRLMTTSAVSGMYGALADGGVLYVSTDLDMERYLSRNTVELGRCIQGTLGEVFPTVRVWPGVKTGFFAFKSGVPPATLGALVARLETLRPWPRYFTTEYLFDRLNVFRSGRIENDLGGGPTYANTLREPRLMRLGLRADAELSRTDAAVMTVVSHGKLWAVGTVVLFVVVFLAAVWRGRSGARPSRLLFLTAGFVSLSAELISFYVLQCTAGLLYWGMALLIGCFMLGLSMGAYLAQGVESRRGVRLALGTIICSLVVFMSTYAAVPSDVALCYHALFLLVTALGTGTLFAGAAKRQYEIERSDNRGRGYGIELLGSALGALLIMPVLLPALGLTVLLAGCWG
jgi:hypothetical protein